jgi:hypothetical protein
MQIMETLQLDKGELLRRTGATELLSGVGLNHTFGTTSEGFTPPRFGAGSKRATPPITAESFTATTGLQGATKTSDDVAFRGRSDDPAAIVHDGYSSIISGPGIGSILSTFWLPSPARASNYDRRLLQAKSRSWI